jgi:hypothetical protein
MSDQTTIPGEEEEEETLLTPVQLIQTVIAALEKEATAPDASARINNIRNLLTLLKVFFNEYSRGTLAPLMKHDLPPDLRSAESRKKPPF